MNNINIGIIELALESEKQKLSFIKANLPMEEIMVCETKQIIYALERQIPKKPEKGFLCPICHTERTKWKANYCPSCGQALDWSGGNGL